MGLDNIYCEICSKSSGFDIRGKVKGCNGLYLKKSIDKVAPGESVFITSTFGVKGGHFIIKYPRQTITLRLNGPLYYQFWTLVSPESSQHVLGWKWLSDTKCHASLRNVLLESCSHPSVR